MVGTTLPAGEEIVKMQELRAIYQNLYQDNSDARVREASLARRIKEGIDQNEWALFS